MTLVFDRRAELAGQPMCHALLVGVSDYSHLPGDNDPPNPEKFNLKKLASPALSAWKLCRWLTDNRASLARELGTVRVLISPSAVEQAKLDPLLPGEGVVNAGPDVDLADWEHFVPEALAWRDDAALNSDGMTFFYYSGHGLERLGDTLLTLQDFTYQYAGGRLMRSFELNANFVAGMGPTTTNHPNMAVNQFYFIDSCREQLVDKKGLAATPGDVWDALSEEDERATPIFMATFPGSVAQAQAGEPTDFAQALLTCLETGAEISDLEDPQKRWPVSSFTLNNALDRYFKGLDTGQYTTAAGMSFQNIKLRWLNQPPPVEFDVQVHPDAAIDVTTVSLTRTGGGYDKQFAARQDYPYKVVAPAGIFAMQADGGEKYGRYQDTQTMNQQRPIWPITMQTGP